MSFEGLKSGMRHWASPQGAVAYRPISGAWVAVGAPLAAPALQESVAEAFAQSAHARGQAALFFGAERSLPGWRSLCIGQQPYWLPEHWARIRQGGRSFKEQLRRARKKGLRVREIGAEELRAEAEGQLGQLIGQWLASRRMAPLGFVVAMEPLYEAKRHRYLLAERGGQWVALLSAVPMPAARGWFIEDLLRTPFAPNGTVETLFDTFMCQSQGAQRVTMGLAPLEPPVCWWLRGAQRLGQPLYDFKGLGAFKRRMRPQGEDPVYLLHRSRWAPRALLLSLRAFADDRLLAFAWRSLWRAREGARPLVEGPRIRDSVTGRALGA